MLRITKDAVEKLSTMTSGEIIAAYARSGEVTEWSSEIIDLKFVDFYISGQYGDDGGELVAHYTALLRDRFEVSGTDAHLYIALSAHGYMGSF